MAQVLAVAALQNFKIPIISTHTFEDVELKPHRDEKASTKSHLNYSNATVEEHLILRINIVLTRMLLILSTFLKSSILCTF